jgi:hypothetical protein
MAQWLLSTSWVVAPIRLAESRWRSGWTLWSWVATTKALGFVLHAVPGGFSVNGVAAGGVAVAHTTSCSSPGRSPQKYPMPDGSIETRPSATSICWKTSVTGYLACWLAAVSSSSGATAAM